MIHPNSDISSFCEQYSSPIDIAPAKTGQKEKKKKEEHMIRPNSDISSFCEQDSAPVDIAPATHIKQSRHTYE